MSHQEFFRGAETRQSKVVFPGTLNANETLFGGELMKWMDEVTFICATRATRQRMFTAKVENLEFICPVKENSIVEVVANVKKAGSVKLEVEVQIFSEPLYSSERHLAAKAVFVMTALNEKNKVTRLSLPELIHSFE
ncbi:hotdog domain-containing protein [Marinilabilia sp.]|uniref:acyl-CoA thioesterase n=1 Tax=Marinilabilia sp. TaxID=2021252 RepID=UPI0025C5D86F|nr:hotdog domain-containing protein [Marinilabilia sp.]